MRGARRHPRRSGRDHAETDEIFPHILHLETGVFVQNIAEPMLNMGVLGRLRRLRFGERQAGDYKFFKKYLRNHLTNYGT